MDQNITRTYTSLGRSRGKKPIFNRLQSKLRIVFDKTFTQDNILKSLLGVLILIVVIPFFLTLLVISGFNEKIVSDMNEIPSDYKTAIVYFPDDKENDFNIKDFFDNISKLYASKRITKLYIFTKSYNSEVITTLDQKLPEDSSIVDDEYLEPLEVCKKVSEKYKLDKVIIWSSNNNLLDLTYSCNSFDILSLGIKSNIKPTLSLGVFTKLMRNILNINFGI
jgi:hypothetical protein